MWTGGERRNSKTACRSEVSAARGSWEGELGVIEVAKRLVAILQRDGRTPGGSQTAAPRSDPGERETTPPPSPAAPADAEAAASQTLATRGAGAKSASATTPSRAARTGPFFDITMLPAGHGDALWIEYGDDDRNTHRCLIDCGTQQTAKELLRRVAALSGARQVPRAVHPVAHRLRSHRRRPAIFQSDSGRPSYRRSLVQRLASPVRPARRATGRDVLDRDPGFRAALECVAGWRGGGGRGRIAADLRAARRDAADAPVADAGGAAQARPRLDPGVEAVRARRRARASTTASSSKASRRPRRMSTRSRRTPFGGDSGAPNGTSTRYHKSVIRETRCLGRTSVLRHWKGAACWL